MISILNVCEFHPSGRKLIQRHPDFNTNAKLNKNHITKRLKDIDLNEAVFDKQEQWHLRETHLSFEPAKNLTLIEGLNSNTISFQFETNSDQCSNKFYENNGMSKYELNINKKILNNFMNIEEELYVQQNILIWSKGSSNMISKDTHNNSRVLISSFTTQNDIKQKPKLLNQQSERQNDVKVIPSICMIDYSTADYFNNLYVFSKSYEDFQFGLEFKVSEIFSTKFGIFLIRDFNKNSKPLGSYENIVYSLVHPLDQLSSVVVFEDDSMQTYRDHSMKILFTSVSPSICVIFNQKRNAYSIYLIRKLTDNEILTFTKNNQSFFDASLSHKMTSKLNSNDSKDDLQNLTFSNLNKSKLSRTLSSSLSISQSSILSPNARLSKSKLSQSFKLTDSHMDIDLGQYVENKLSIDICLEHLWSESFDSDEPMSSVNRMASKVFVSVDIFKQTYVCYLIQTQNVLVLMPFSYSNNKNFSFAPKIEIVARDAICIPKLCMFAVLDMMYQVNLYTGNVYVCRLQLDNTVSTNIIGTSRHLKKQNFFDRFQNVRLTGLRECVNRKLVLEYENGKFVQIEIPPYFTSNLIEKTLCTLNNVLTKSNAVNLVVLWYRKRNTPGIRELSTQEEWELFEVVIMSMLGYLIEKTNEDEGSVNFPKKHKKTESEDTIWMKFLGSPHHELVGKQVISLLHMKQVKNIEHQSETNVIFDYNYNSNSTLLSEFQTIFYSLHLLYEELKLNQVFTDHLILLATFLDKLAIDFSLNQYSSYYRHDFPSIAAKNDAKNRQLQSKIKLNECNFSISNEPPDIMNSLYQLLNNASPVRYPYLKHVNPRSNHIINIYLMILQRIDPNAMLVELENNAKTTLESIKAQNLPNVHKILLYMFLVGITNEILEILPIGVSLPIYEALWQCRENPPKKWPKDAYELLYRDDLLAHINLNKDINNEDNYKYTKLPNKSEHNGEKIREAEVRDGMENIEYTALKYRFTDDKRVRSVRKMLQSCEQVKIVIKKKPESSDHDFIEEQEKHLYSICLRTMALPVGRGMFTLRTMQPMITETFMVPKLCLHGKLHPTGTTVDLTHIDLPPRMNVWPLFHNGVAAGLKISENAKNITSPWILFNRPKTLGESSMEHAGFLMALGLNGLLQNFNAMSLYEYLIRFSRFTSLGLLLGLSASRLGTMKPFLTKILSLHIESLLPPTSIELDIPPYVQSASLMGIGLLYHGSGHRSMAENMLNEIRRPPGPEMEHSQDRDSYALIAGLALGMIMLQQGCHQLRSDDLHITDKLYYLIFGGKKNLFKERYKEKSKNLPYLIKEGSNLNLNITAPGALMALALMYLDSNDEGLAFLLEIPDTQPLIELIRPDLLMLRVLTKDLIMWSRIKSEISWVEEHVPDIMKPYCLKVPENDDDESLTTIDYETMNLGYCNIVTGACFAMGLRYAGTENRQAFKALMHYLKLFMSITIKSVADLTGKIIIEVSLITVLVSLGLVMAGTGNIEILRICRFLRSRIGTACSSVVTYGSHMAVHMTMGLLFLGGGRYTISNSPKAISFLLCAFFPKYPIHSADNRFHMQALRHFYVLATEPRLFLPKSIISGQVVFANIKVVLLTDEELHLRAPCILPPISTIKKVQVNDKNMLQIVFERNRNWNQLLNMLNNKKFICVKPKAQSSYNEDSIIALSKSSLIPAFFHMLLKKSFVNEPIYGLCIKKFLITNPYQESNFIRLLSMAVYECLNKDNAIALPFWIFIIKNLEQNPKLLTKFGLWQVKLIFAKMCNDSIKNTFIPMEIVLAVKENLNRLINDPFFNNV